MTTAPAVEPHDRVTGAGEVQSGRVVVDTSVLISDPAALFTFGLADVVVPLTVVEELDSLKSRLDEVGRSAREALRSIEELRVGAGGEIRSPVALPAGGTLRVETNGLQIDRLMELGLDTRQADNRILAAALGLQELGGTAVLVVTNDAALRIKAAQLGLGATEHVRARLAGRSRPAGWVTVDTDTSVVDQAFTAGQVGAEVLAQSGTEFEPVPNSFVVLRSGQQSALCRWVGDNLELLAHRPPRPWGLDPRSKEQRFAVELLTDPDVSVVAMDGPAGTGKTLLALAAGLEQVVEVARYDRVAIYRPIVPVGRTDLGFLPGDLSEKLDPWMAAVRDAVVALTEKGSHADADQIIDELVDRGQLSLEAVTFLRGRTLHRSYVVVDEAQNLEPAVMKTILTRIGEGTKVVVTGDTSQIDQAYLSEHTNALSVLVQAFGGQEVFGHVRLTRGERSTVASLAADLL